jgi:2-oxo-4-hydroxy-4-carboxy--5-ureidoimidazoline (OHCU) decarboxylase
LDENITTMKKDIKEEILKEVKMEMNKKFEELKKEYNAKFDISFSDEDTMKIKDNIHSYTTTRLFNKIL